MSRVMKDSGVEWIGLIPKSWTVNRIKEKFSIVNGSTPKSDVPEFWDGDIVWVTPIDMYNNVFLNDSRKKITESGYLSCGTTLVPKGSIVISTRAPIGQISIAGIKLCTNQGCKSLVATNETNERYLFYLLSISTEILNFFGRGTTFLELSTKDLANFVYSSPTLNIQNRIVDYLDKQCATIDRLISLQEEMIAELQAYKQSVITEAVTKGLDPNVPMKDSGVEWIGGIPEKWQLRKTTDVCSRITDFVASGSFADLKKNVEYLNEPDYAMLVRTTDVSEKGGDRKPVFINKTAYDFLSNSNLFGGELILPNIGAVGDIYVVPKLYERMSLAPNAILIEPKVDSLYFYYYFKSCIGQEQLRSLSQSTAQPKFNKTQFSMIRMPVPPEDEMREISEHLDFKCKSIDQMISLKQTKLDALKEYKKSLIYECVTGKREVV